MDRDAALLVRPFDDDARHAGLLQPFAQMIADLDVFLEQLAVFASCPRTSANPRCG